MKNSHKTWLIFPAIFVALLLTSPLSRAGEGGQKSTDGAKSKKSCFTLLNAKEIPADVSVEQRLALARVDVYIDGQTFEEVLMDLGKTLGVPVVILPSARDECDKWSRSGEYLDGTVHGISARSYLDYLFYMMNLDEIGWTARDGKIVISQNDYDIETKVHKISKLLDPTQKSYGWNNFSDGFVALVTTVIDPESWQEVGGPGSLESLELSGAKVLIVRNNHQVQDQVAALIAGFEQMLAEKEPGGSLALDEAARKQFRKAMDMKVTLDCEETPLFEFVAMIEKQIGMPMLLDRRGLEDLGLSVDIPISYQCKDRPLWLVQKEVLYDIESTWTSRFGTIMLTTQEQEYLWSCVTLFEVTDLAKVPGSAEFDMDSLIELVTNTVDPESWAMVGGMGWIEPFTSQGRAFFAISQAGRTTKEVHRLFAGLRMIAKGKINCFPQPTKEDLLLRKKLTKRTDWKCEEMPLDEFFADLKRKHGIDSRIDQRALEDLGYSIDFPMTFQMDDCSIGEVLSIVLDSLESDWAIRDGRVFVSTQEEFCNNLSTKIYEVSDLSVFVDTQGNKHHDLDSLVEVITMAVDPESWQEVGGPGSIELFSFCGRNVVVIRQTYPAHQEVAKLFADLRAAMPKDPAKRRPPVRTRRLVERGGGFGDGRLSGMYQNPHDEIATPVAGRRLPDDLPPLHPGEATLVESNNAFAMKLYGQMVREQGKIDKNTMESGLPAHRSFCFSPYSVAALLQAIKVGTRGETESELQKSLCLTLSGEELHGAYGSLLTSLMADPLHFGGFGTPGPNTEFPTSPYKARSLDLSFANRIWIQEKGNAQVLPEFTKTLEKYYLCGAEEVDFNNPTSSARRINDWVSQQTRDRIDQIISGDDIIPEFTRVVAINAVFFQGKWDSPFQASQTKPKPFYDSDGKTKLGKVSMMSKTHTTCQFGQVDGVSILNKSYRGGASFVVLLPPPGEGELEKLQNSLSVDRLHKWLKATKSEMLERLEMPKFKLDKEFSLIDAMRRLGINDLFDDKGADFSGMFSPESPWSKDALYVYLLRHKATIEVDEVGTVATAVTMGGMGGGMMMPEINEFIANRPFLFLIVDDKTSSILFMGRYMGPEKKVY